MHFLHVLLIILSDISCILFCKAPIICGDDEFECTTTGLCIPLNLTCDGVPQCFDESDEEVSAGCGKC